MIKKLSLFVIVFLFAVIVFYAPAAEAAGNKGVILSTVDLKADYEILGIVSYRSSETMPDRIDRALREQAADMGADYVIGVTYYSGFGYLYGSGTAVKLIKKNKDN
ncbi:MAG: hypothetical protein PHI59_04860 [Candidatus Omnitrophica bacterium]|nr:hypothetical protein [Candidatus Omnitrophota bacterium]